MLAGALPCAALTPAPGERIAWFTADLTIRNDTSIDVREEFVVHSEETYFKWGWFRFLPISSDARWDKRFGGGGKTTREYESRFWKSPRTASRFRMTMEAARAMLSCESENLTCRSQEAITEL